MVAGRALSLMDPDKKRGHRYLRWGDEVDGWVHCRRVDGATFIQLPNFHTPPQTPLALILASGRRISQAMHAPVLGLSPALAL